MNSYGFLDLFQGITTMMASSTSVVMGRIFLVILGLLLIYLGKKGILEPLLMIPMGLGMATINVSTLFLTDGKQGNLFLDPMLTDTDQLVNILQIDAFQPLYTLAFGNGLIACFIFMGIGVMIDLGYLLQRPFQSMFLAMFAELGTFLTIPIALYFGLDLKEAASIAMVGGADGPMVLFTSLNLAKHLLVPITVVAYLYLGITYGLYPYMIRMLIPLKLRKIPMPKDNSKPASSSTKLYMACILCVFLCFLFPVASPLFFSLFLGIVVRESGLKSFANFISGPLLYSSTLFLGVMLGLLCDAHTIFDAKVLPLLILGIIALILSGLGGIMGGYILYIFTKGKYNPIIGIAGVSCVPTTAKIAQKEAAKANPMAMILPHALGANICGVITTAIITGLYIMTIPLIK